MADLPPQPHKRPRTDPVIEAAKLPTPVVFTAIRPKPRLWTIKQAKVPEPAGAGAGAAAASSASAGAGAGLVAAGSAGEAASSSGAVADPGSSASEAGAARPTAGRTRGAGRGRAVASAPAAAGGAAAGGGGAGYIELPRPPSVIALDEYLTWVGNTYYTAAEVGRAGSDWALIRRTTLGGLSLPRREGGVVDIWSPLQVARFEAAICTHGKNFGALARACGKTPAECIEFFYFWKGSKNYAAWRSMTKASGL